MTVLAARNLTVRRAGRAIVADVSLDFASGSFVGLIGPNGAGKSTLLSALAGLLAPDAGTIALDGTPIDEIDRRALARRRAYLPQNPRAEWPVPVERLIGLGLIPQLPVFGGLPPAMRQRIDEVIDQFDMHSHRLQPATTLSGGELARAMLARALVGDPELLLADEPLAGLDPRHSLDGIKRLRGLAGQGKLVIASLHDLTLAARFTTHIAVMSDGVLAAYGPTASVLSAELLREVFEVDACISGAGSETAIVDFVAAPQL